MAATTISPCPECRKLNRVPIAEPGAGAHRRPICGSCKTELPLHGAVNELSASGLMALVQSSPLPIVADFWAPWCQPCKVFAPIFEQTASSLGGEFVFVKVDTQSQPLAGDTYGIRGIPTLIVFREGFEGARISGALSLEQ